MGESIKPIGAPAGNKNESKLDNKSRYSEPIETKNKYNEPSFGSKRSQYPN
jgi:hypothetical protein